MSELSAESPEIGGEDGIGSNQIQQMILVGLSRFIYSPVSERDPSFGPDKIAKMYEFSD